MLAPRPRETRRPATGRRSPGRWHRRSRGPARRRRSRRWPDGSGRRSASAPPSGMPGPGVVDGQRDPRLVRRRRETVTAPPSGEYLQALSSRTPEQPVEPLGRHGDDHAPGRDGAGPGSGRASRRRPRTGRPSGGEDAQVDRLGVGLALRRVEPRQPQQVLEEPPHPLRLDGRRVPNAFWYHSASRVPARARLVWASMTDSGVRSSCEASAVNSSWRWRAARWAPRPAGRSAPRRGTRR